MSKYSELADRMAGCRSGSLPQAWAHEAAAALRELEAERDRLRELIRHMDIEHDSSWWSRDVSERIAAVLEPKQ